VSQRDQSQHDQWKQAAAERAAGLVRPGMVVGLGTGSTAIFAIRRIGALLQSGELDGVVGVATSSSSEAEALRLGIRLLEDFPREIDLTIDGADEVDPAMNLIKGGGGALLREKIVAQASRRVVIVVDEGKLSPALGIRHPLPVEVVGFGWQSQASYLEALIPDTIATLRPDLDGDRYITDHGNLILDWATGPLARPAEVAACIDSRAGVVEHGLFLGLATDLIVGGVDGVRHRTRG
jgi:ribose 5-phosphate isomerase A